MFRLEGPSMPAVVHPSEAINPKTSASPRAIELIKRKVAIPRPDRTADHLAIHATLSTGDSEPGTIRERSPSRSSNLSAGSGRPYAVHDVGPHFKQLSVSSQTEVSSTAALSTK